jgi:ATP-dependent DNA helicase RecG
MRTVGGDATDVEVKSAAGGLPESLTATLNALANLPGGGAIILGLDERTGFHLVGQRDPQRLKQGLATKARSYIPPVSDVEEQGFLAARRPPHFDREPAAPDHRRD